MNMEIRFKLPVKATLRQLRRLFRTKDETQSTIEDFLGYEVSAGEALLICSEFYRRLVESGLNVAKSFELRKEELLCDSEQDSAKSRPISFGVEVSVDDARIIKDNITVVAKFLEQKYEKEFKSDYYLVLMEIYKFVLLKKQSIFRSYGLYRDEDEKEQGLEDGTDIPCDVCGDASSYNYCSANTCGKCRGFLRQCMRQRCLVSLRCAANNNCKDEFGNVDITCQSCRLERCKELKMIEAYFITDDKAPGCVVCKSQSLAGNSHLFGKRVCVPCKHFFVSSLAKSGYLEYTCIDSRCCPVSQSEDGCKFCRFYAFREQGFLELFQAMTGARESGEDVAQGVIFKSRILCSICGSSARSRLFLNLPVCWACQSFFTASMHQSAYLSYCCPEGEAGLVCELRHDNLSRCLYCWIRRCEVEGVVDRWFMCGEDASLWTNPSARRKTTGVHVPVIQAPYDDARDEESDVDVDEEEHSASLNQQVDDITDEIVEEE